MSKDTFEINERVKIKDLILRPEWIDYIVTIADKHKNYLIKIKEFEGDEVYQNIGEDSTWINISKVEKLYRLPEELFKI